MVWAMLLRSGAVLVLIAVFAGSGFAANQAPPSVSALTTLPPPSKPLPADLKFAVGRAANYIGLDARVALRRVRLLRSNVTGLPLYAFGGNGSVCFMLWRGGGTCARITAPNGVRWFVSGGSRRRGQAVVGIVPDSVKALRVRVSGTWHVVKPVHNAFYFAYRQTRFSVARPAVVAVTR